MDSEIYLALGLMFGLLARGVIKSALALTQTKCAEVEQNRFQKIALENEGTYLFFFRTVFSLKFLSSFLILCLPLCPFDHTYTDMMQMLP